MSFRDLQRMVRRELRLNSKPYAGMLRLHKLGFWFDSTARYRYLKEHEKIWGAQKDDEELEVSVE